MIQATCRCGQLLKVPEGGEERVVCPKCGSKVRVRRGSAGPASAGAGDGFVRFFCPCGRRLKVPAVDPPTHGKCPDCQRIVPVPRTGSGSSGARTEELGPRDIEQLRQWAAEHVRRGSRVPAVVIPEGAGPADALMPTAPDPKPAPPEPAEAVDVRSEVGLRLCPTCGKPLHLRAETCRSCGTPVPRREGQESR